MYFLLNILLIFFQNVHYTLQVERSLYEKRINHQPLEVRTNVVKYISNKLTDTDHLKQVTKKILIPRIVGTKGHDKVKKYIIKSMENLGWYVETDKFEDKTPNMGVLTFENIITTLNPNAERFLVLACHYDSKYVPNEEFLGATDSAVPCAMLINLAYVLKKHLKEYRDNSNLSLKFIFFDGEEAFENWSLTDSIYGAKHLANKWMKENFLDRIDVLVLLDLIGTSDPKFYNFFEDTDRWFMRLVHAEERLAEEGLLENYSKATISTKHSNTYFQSKSIRANIEDDHIPFMNLGVPILHLIPFPFPDVWHTISDDHSIIDYTAVENLNRILRTFVVEYLHLIKTDQ